MMECDGGINRNASGGSMNQDELENLVVRVDTKLDGIYELSKRHDKHLENLNNKVAKNAERSIENSQKIAGLTNEVVLDRSRQEKIEDVIMSGVSLRFSRKQMLGGGASIMTLISLIIALLAKILGWW